MREILFKAKRKDNNEWIYGNLIYKKCLRDNGMPEIYCEGWIEEYVYIYEDNAVNNIEEYPTIFIEVIPETICQYTGLKDKNGVKIFENDILQGFEEYYDEFVKGMIDLDLYNGTQLVVGENSYHLDYIYDYEVIGNAFDKEAK